MKEADVTVGQFQERWFRHFGKKLTEEEAQEYRDRIDKLVAFVLRQELRRRGRSPP
jgi:hypothetical protein